MSLWRQMFEPEPLEMVQYTIEEFNQAWNWIFQDGYGPASLRMSIIRTKSLALRKRLLIKDSSKMACVDTWRKQTQIKCVSVPPRKVNGIPARKKPAVSA